MLGSFILNKNILAELFDYTNAFSDYIESPDTLDTCTSPARSTDTLVEANQQD